MIERSLEAAKDYGAKEKIVKVKVDYKDIIEIHEEYNGIKGLAVVSTRESKVRTRYSVELIVMICAPRANKRLFFHFKHIDNIRSDFPPARSARYALTLFERIHEAAGVWNGE